MRVTCVRELRMRSKMSYSRVSVTGGLKGELIVCVSYGCAPKHQALPKILCKLLGAEKIKLLYSPCLMVASCPYH